MQNAPRVKDFLTWFMNKSFILSVLLLDDEEEEWVKLGCCDLGKRAGSLEPHDED